MKIGVYGGTFDPVHNGHLILARDAVEQLGLDELVFIPNAISPHRLAQAPTPGPVRLEMILAAIEGEPRFKADDVELRRGDVSYTYDTIVALKEKYPTDAELFYFIGHDNLPKLSTWHRFADLKKLVTFVVFTRGATDTSHEYPGIERRVDISATEVRARVAKSLSIRYLVPDAVSEIIARHNLYKE